MSLVLDTISHRFGAVVALREVVARFELGRTTVLLGKNGAGKSTLLRCAIGALRPERGRVQVDGVALQRMARGSRAARIAFVAQRPLFGARLRVREVVELGRFALSARPRRVEEAIELMGLGDSCNRIASELSAGFQQRVALARAFAQIEPTGWLVLDEPAAALDPAATRVLVAALRGHVVAGGGVVATVHDLVLAAAIADEAILLREGRVLAAGVASRILRPEQLEAAFDAPFWLARLGDQEHGREVAFPRLQPSAPEA